MPSMHGDPVRAKERWQFGEDPSLSPAAISLLPSIWAGHLDRITQLYCVEEKSLRDIQCIMKSEHNFFATPRQYHYWIRRWGLRRNIKSSEYQVMAGSQVKSAVERADSSSVHKPDYAKFEYSKSRRELDRSVSNEIARPSFLSKDHTYNYVEQADIYRNRKELAADDKENEEVRQTNRILQFLPKTSNSAWRPAEDGTRSFNCPCCTNLYFYDDLFKLHLLQHLGENPYVCLTCGDTFSRLDVLSRHYQECSRGSPIGAIHFPHSHAHLKSGPEASIYAGNSNSSFIPESGQKVDMQKVDVEFLKKWIRGRIAEVLGPLRTSIDTYRPISECFDIIERNKFLDIASMQLVLHELLGAETATFCEDMWELCRSRTSNSQGNPSELLAGRELEMAQEKIAAESTVEEAPQSVEVDEHDSDLGSVDFPRTQFQKKDRLERLASTEDSVISGCNQNDNEHAYVFDNLLSHFQFLAADQYAQWSSNDSALSDGESTDTGSAWMSDFSGVCSLGESHPFNLIKPIVVEKGLLAYQNARQRTQTGSSTGATSGNVNTALGAKHVISSPPKKRSRNNQDGSEEAGDSEDDEELPAKRGRTSKRAVGNQPSFACPFAKKNPLKYRGCYAYVLKRVRDVKQHLSRFHQLPIYCPRCTDTFEAEDERDEHIRSSSCLVQHETIIFEGVTRAQKVLLGQRVSAKMTSSDQWFTIFDILFPGHMPRPKCAYINTELSIELEAFQDLMYTEGPRFISSAIWSSGLDISARENVEDDSTALLQSAIQEGLQQVFQQWSANMPGIEQESTDSKHTTTAGSSTSSTYPGIQGSELSRSSSKTLVEGIQEKCATAEQDIPFREYTRYQDHALPQEMSSSSEDMVADACTLLPSNSNQQNPKQIRNADIQTVVPDGDINEDAANFGSLVAKSWGASESEIFVSSDLWNFDPAFDEALEM